MTKFKKTNYIKLRDDFDAAWKVIEPYIKRRPLTKNDTLRDDYKNDIVRTYNEFLDYAVKTYAKTTEQNQKILDERIFRNNDKIKRAFDILNLKYEFTNNVYDLIQIKNVVIKDDSVSDFTSGTIGESSSKSSTEELTTTISLTEIDNDDSRINELEETLTDNDNTNDNISDELNDNLLDDLNDNLLENPENELNMTQKKEEFLKLASSIINYKYNGDSIKRDGFIADIELVADICEAQNVETCFKFVKSKLEGRAFEALDEDVKTVRDIIGALKKDIKLEPSTVIESRFAALRLEKSNFSKFTESAEKQAEALRRSLVNEGITKAKAQEMTIRKTVELCRRTTKSEVVKSVLSAASYDTPSDVLATFVTQTDIARKERREDEQNKQKDFKGKNYQNRKKFNKFRNNNGHSGHQNGNNRQQNGFNRNSNNNNNRQNNSGNFRNNRNNNNRSNEHTIRFVQGNGQAPPSGGQHQDQAEQYYHLPLNIN